jgi:hypothetical protein
VTTTRFVTLAYGDDEGIFRQVWMLLVSLRAFAPRNVELVVLTDRPERYAALDGISVERLDATELDRWRRGGAGWRHKLEVERALLPDDGALVLLDSDILAVAPLDPFIAELHAAALFLHKEEYVLSQSRRTGNRRMWDELRDREFGPWQLQPSDAMWNAGVVALTSRDRELVDDALELHDAVAAAGVAHPFLEQLATSVVFGRTGRLRPAQPYFAHYWGNKPAFDVEIRKRIATGATIADAARQYRSDPIALPVEDRPGPLTKLAAWLRA